MGKARGGKRNGAGRPASRDRKQKISVYVTRELADYLSGDGRSDKVETAIRNTKNFKLWMRTHDDLH